MRLLIIAVILALMGALGIYLSLPEGQWLLEQFAHNQASLWLQGQMAQAGWPINNYGPQILLALALVALFLVHMLAKKAKKYESRIQGYQNSLDEKDKEIARLRKALSEASEPEHTTEADKRAALKNEEDDIEATFELLDEYLADLRGRVNVFRQFDEAEDHWPSQLEALRSGSVAAKTDFRARRKEQQFANVMNHLQGFIDRNGKKLELLNHDELVDKKDELEETIRTHEDDYELLSRDMDGLTDILARTKALDGQLGLALNSGGILAQLRDAERTLEGVKIRMQQLEPESGNGVIDRLEDVKEKIEKFEDEFDQLDIGSRRSEIDSLHRRLADLGSQLGREVTPPRLRAAE